MKTLTVLVLAFLSIHGIVFLFRMDKTIIVESNVAEASSVEDRGIYLESHPPSTNKERVEVILDKRGFSEKERVLDIIECESGFKPDATYRNSDKHKTLDRGTCMWNDFWHDEISDECAFSLNCSVNAMIDYLERTGDFGAWYCDKG